jgi:hypothetical protein
VWSREPEEHGRLTKIVAIDEVAFSGMRAKKEVGLAKSEIDVEDYTD